LAETAAETTNRFTEEHPPDGLVVDVAMPGAPGYEISLTARASGVAVIILVASVFRKTSYKRRPVRLYGADDYVEIHHIGDALGKKLREQLNWSADSPNSSNVREIVRQINENGDNRLERLSPQQLASVLVSDIILYHGDKLVDIDDKIAIDQLLQVPLQEAKKIFLHYFEIEDEHVVDQEFSNIVWRMAMRAPG